MDFSIPELQKNKIVVKQWFIKSTMKINKKNRKVLKRSPKSTVNVALLNKRIQSSR